MFIELDEEGLELHPLMVRRLKQHAAICITRLLAVVNSLVKKCPDNDACDGLQWTFIMTLGLLRDCILLQCIELPHWCSRSTGS